MEKMKTPYAYKCHKKGHYARGCAAKRQSSENTGPCHSGSSAGGRLGGTPTPICYCSIVPSHSYYLLATIDDTIKYFLDNIGLEFMILR